MAYFISRKCHVADCTNPAFGDGTTCGMCPVITCRQHNLDPPKGKGHTCVELELPDGTSMALTTTLGGMERDSRKTKVGRRYQYTFAWLDSHLIVEQAQALRPGHTCTLTIPSSDDIFKDDKWKSSHMNVHLPLVFDDGVRWMVRARQWNARNPPATVQRQVTASEVATLQFLKANGVKVPMAWISPVVHDARESPIDYFFMEFVEGSAPFVDLSMDEMTASPVIDQFIDDLASYFITISNAPLPSSGIGSLYRKEGDTFTVGPLCTAGYLMNPHPPHFLGPFKTQKERYLSHFDYALDYIYLFSPDFGIDQIIMYLWVAEARELVRGCAELDEVETEFYVKHGDDWLRQYFADEEGKITGVLDWEWAFVTTKAEAFSLPHDMYINAYRIPLADDSPTPVERLLISALERQQRPDLADCVRQGRLYQNIKHVLQCGGYPRSVSDINNLRQVILGDQAGKPWETVQEWEKATVEKYKEDPRLVDMAWRLYKRAGTRPTSDPTVLMLVKGKLETGNGGEAGRERWGCDGTRWRRGEGAMVAPGI
ncbi:hypothetical protein IAT38_003558 [Cryptococcus sp. DSM 104549]